MAVFVDVVAAVTWIGLVLTHPPCACRVLPLPSPCRSLTASLWASVILMASVLRFKPVHPPVFATCPLHAALLRRCYRVAFNLPWTLGRSTLTGRRSESSDTPTSRCPVVSTRAGRAASPTLQFFVGVCGLGGRPPCAMSSFLCRHSPSREPRSPRHRRTAVPLALTRKFFSRDDIRTNTLHPITHMIRSYA